MIRVKISCCACSVLNMTQILFPCPLEDEIQGQHTPEMHWQFASVSGGLWGLYTRITISVVAMNAHSSNTCSFLVDDQKLVVLKSLAKANSQQPRSVFSRLLCWTLLCFWNVLARNTAQALTVNTTGCQKCSWTSHLCDVFLPGFSVHRRANDVR